MKALKSKWVGKLASRLWGGARRLWIRPAKHRWWPPAVLALVLGIVFVFLTDPTKAIWSWPGASAAGINGLDKPAIARRLHLSYHTVGNHVRNIYQKLHVSNRAQAVAKAIREDLV